MNICNVDVFEAAKSGSMAFAIFQQFSYNILRVNKSELTERRRRWWKRKSPAPELSSFYIDWKFSILQFPKFSFLFFFVQHRVQKLWPLKAKCVERGERKLYFSEQPKTFPRFLSFSLAIRDLREKLEAFRFNFLYCFSPRPFFSRFHSPPPSTVVSRWWISQ